MKAKKILSMIIAAAMAIQCAAISAVASEPADGVTVVASDSTTDWKMPFNSWERIEAAFKKYTSWSVNKGFKFSHDHDKYKAINNVAYHMKKVGDAFTEYSAAEPEKDDFQRWFNVDSLGNPVPYGTEGSTAQLWYRKSRHFNMADFAVTETEADQRPAVISFTFKTTNASTGFYGNEPATSYAILGDKDKEVFSIIPNAKATANGEQFDGFLIQYYDSSINTNSYKKIGERQVNTEHDVKVIISPELTADGRYQMEAISVDGVVTKLENIYGMKNGLKNMLIHSIRYKSGMRVSASF